MGYLFLDFCFAAGFVFFLGSWLYALFFIFFALFCSVCILNDSLERP